MLKDLKAARMVRPGKLIFSDPVELEIIKNLVHVSNRRKITRKNRESGRREDYGKG
jgi:hypothetical protein